MFFLWSRFIFLFGLGFYSLGVTQTGNHPYWIQPNQMQHQTVFAEPVNSLIRLRCLAGGVPAPNITWYKGDTRISLLKRPGHLSPYKERPDKYQLKIPSLSVSDEGIYTCVVANRYGTIVHSYRIEALPLLQHKPVDNPTSPADDSFIWPMIRIEKVKRELTEGESDADNPWIMVNTEYEIRRDPTWEWERENLRLGEPLGEGYFGKVVRGEALHIIENGKPMPVAVKMLKNGHSDRDFMDFIIEIEILKMICWHPNIIKLLAVCPVRDGSLLSVVEFAEHGDLKGYLNKFSEQVRGQNDDGVITIRQLISFAQEICVGMEYLASKRCIHRDLAARNILLATDHVIKIADFGLARTMHNCDYYKKAGKGRLPMLWMAPEALFQNQYSLKSDVWSFGIVLWEIITLGSRPYSNILCLDDICKKLNTGYRMEIPHACHPGLYMIMQKTWAHDPAERPAFSQIIKELDKFVQNAPPHYLNFCLPNSSELPYFERPTAQGPSQASPTPSVSPGSGFEMSTIVKYTDHVAK